MNKLYAQIIGSFPFCFSFVLLLRVVDSGISKDIVTILLVSVLFFFLLLRLFSTEKLIKIV